MSSLPFTIRGVHGGFVDLEGIASLEDTELVLEFRLRHVLAWFVKTNTKEMRIPLSELEEVTLKRRLFRGVLILRARRLSLFSTIPGDHGSELRLRCRREHYHIAQDLASRVGMRIMEKDLKAMVASTDGLGPSP